MRINDRQAANRAQNGQTANDPILDLQGDRVGGAREKKAASHFASNATSSFLLSAPVLQALPDGNLRVEHGPQNFSHDRRPLVGQA